MCTKTERKTLETIEEEGMDDEEGEEQQKIETVRRRGNDNDDMREGEEDMLFDGLLDIKYFSTIWNP